MKNLRLFMLVLGLVVTAAPPAEAQSAETVEYKVKLAFIYNLTKFVEWPANSYRDADAPLSICIIGADPFSPELENELRTRRVDGHPVELKRLRSGEAIPACQIVFIPLAAKSQIAAIVRDLRGSSTLTVSEAEGFGELGGMVNFAVEGNRLHLEVNPLAADRAGLKISSKLLGISNIVKDR